MNIATKLARHFISDTLPQEAIDMIAEVTTVPAVILLSAPRCRRCCCLHSGEGDSFFSLRFGFSSAQGDFDVCPSPSTVEMLRIAYDKLRCSNLTPELQILRNRMGGHCCWITPELMDRRLRYIGQLVNLGGLRQVGSTSQVCSHCLALF